MIRELRELSLTVARCGAAIEMPEVITARDDLIRRYVESAIPRRVATHRTPSFPDVDVDELPLYWS